MDGVSYRFIRSAVQLFPWKLGKQICLWRRYHLHLVVDTELPEKVDLDIFQLIHNIIDIAVVPVPEIPDIGDEASATLFRLVSS